MICRHGHTAGKGDCSCFQPSPAGEGAQETLELRGYALWRLVSTDDEGQRWVCVAPDVRRLLTPSVTPERVALVDDLLEYADYFKNKNHTDQIGVPTRKLRNRLREAAAALRGETGA